MPAFLPLRTVRQVRTRVASRRGLPKRSAEGFDLRGIHATERHIMPYTQNF